MLKCKALLILDSMCRTLEPGKNIATGESIFKLESFQELINNQAVDIVHPDMATSGVSLFV